MSIEILLFIFAAIIIGGAYFGYEYYEKKQEAKKAAARKLKRKSKNIKSQDPSGSAKSPVEGLTSKKQDIPDPIDSLYFEEENNKKLNGSWFDATLLPDSKTETKPQKENKFISEDPINSIDFTKIVKVDPIALDTPADAPETIVDTSANDISDAQSFDALEEAKNFSITDISPDTNKKHDDVNEGLNLESDDGHSEEVFSHDRSSTPSIHIDHVEHEHPINVEAVEELSTIELDRTNNLEISTSDDFSLDKIDNATLQQITEDINKADLIEPPESLNSSDDLDSTENNGIATEDLNIPKTPVRNESDSKLDGDFGNTISNLEQISDDLSEPQNPSKNPETDPLLTETEKTKDIARSPDEIFDFDKEFNVDLLDNLLAPINSPFEDARAGRQPKKVAKVLYVDDARIYRKSMENIFKNIGCKVILATDGDEALRMLLEDGETVDMIFSDVEMPNMDGFTLFGHLNKDDRTKNIPFVIITASNDHMKTSRSLGCSSEILKPYTEDDIESSLRKYIPQFFNN